MKEPPKAEGEACTTDLQCETGLCFALQGQSSLCKRKCTAGCTKEEVCTQVDLNRYGCVPMREGLCKPCQTNSDCPYPADICISVGGAKVCGRDCSFDNACPESFHCLNGRTAEGSEVLAQCQPNSNTCACTAASVGQKITCQNTSDAGTCVGSSTCQIAGYTTCSALVPTAEVCNGKDDNCNTQIDENLGDTTCGVGECKRVFANCANGVPQQCVPGMPSLDICNDKDDDCDGTVDNGIDKNSIAFCGSCTNSCTAANGTPKCTSGACGVDTCTAPFKDCDAVYANGCEANTNTSLLHCGGCAKPCAAANATPMCSTGVCTFTCLPGFGDLDKVASNGCEASCTAADAPDLGFTDSNCDGIDGVEAKAIFVDAMSGSDANAGTKGSPKKTIGAGITAAAAANPTRDVYVSQGIYAESVVLQSGVSLYGSYNAANNWSRAVANLTLILSSSNVGVRGNQLGSPTTVQLFSINAAAATGTVTGGGGRSSFGVLITDSTGGVTLSSLTISNGSGADGSPGSNGATGPQGGIGADASGVTPGGPGASSCLATGGAGGMGVLGAVPGAAGNPGVQASMGGAGAAGGNPGGAGACGGTSSSNGGGAPALTANGTVGGPGTGGNAGVQIGALDASSLYLPPSASGGTNGFPGGGGGGGGSGGGSANGDGVFTDGCTNCTKITSGGGGGGGGGGCGGFPGAGGKGGGGSFAIAALNSVVTIDGAKMTTGNGGAGGKGGDGGDGGLGGQPGSGSTGQTRSNSCSTRSGGAGASGSVGGQGGKGGGGAGGAGGPSICIFYKGIVPTTNNLNCTNGTVGMGGVGGSGFQVAANGAAGASGVLTSSN